MIITQIFFKWLLGSMAIAWRLFPFRLVLVTPCKCAVAIHVQYDVAHFKNRCTVLGARSSCSVFLLLVIFFSARHIRHQRTFVLLLLYGIVADTYANMLIILQVMHLQLPSPSPPALYAATVKTVSAS